jgi:hypothetical protein
MGMRILNWEPCMGMHGIEPRAGSSVYALIDPKTELIMAVSDECDHLKLLSSLKEINSDSMVFDYASSDLNSYIFAKICDACIN